MGGPPSRRRGARSPHPARPVRAASPRLFPALRRLAPRALAAAALAAAGATAAPLPRPDLDPADVGVSGLSSGGYMAVQLHVAHSATFTAGVGAVAAGPYYCAEGRVRHATGRCLDGGGPIPVERLVTLTRSWAADGLIDPTEGLGRTRAYLFTGARDSVVPLPVGEALQRYYLAFLPPQQLRWRRDIPAEHGFVTDGRGGDCERRNEGHINDCGFDLAGELLAHLHGPLQPPAAPEEEEAAGRLVELDQRRFIDGRGLADTGWLYLPPACEGAQAQRCRLHLVLHGCGQNRARLGERYVRETGYLRWADANRLVLLFPQVHRSAPNACWDWWGYAGADYALRQGAQVAALKMMVDELLGRPVRCHEASPLAHLRAGRARWSAGGVVARGSGQSLGWPAPFGTVALREAGEGHFQRVAHCGTASR